MHKWKFDGGKISREQLRIITDDFKKVLPYLQAEFEVTDIDYYYLWTAFRGQEDTDEFLFGVFNSDHGNKIYCSLEDYNEAVTAFFAIAKRHLGHSIHVETTDSDDDWREGISICQNILGHDYDLMDITENGKLRYAKWKLATHGQ